MRTLERRGREKDAIFEAAEGESGGPAAGGVVNSAVGFGCASDLARAHGSGSGRNGSGEWGGDSDRRQPRRRELLSAEI